MGVLYGPSGYGKTIAVSNAATRYRAVYVECRSYFTKKSLLLTILDEMAIRPGNTIYEMVKQIAEQLVLSQRPLIIDEMDHIVDRNLVEIVRDIYEVSNAAILMVGEEKFPSKLKRWERFHNRILDWQPAEPADLDDAKKLAKLYSPDVPIGEDLLARIVEVTRGVTRRVCVNVENVRQEAKKSGERAIDLKTWGSRGFYTGEAPLRRVA
jgi:DNA transposition AAA+ family ATPase